MIDFIKDYLSYIKKAKNFRDFILRIKRTIRGRQVFEMYNGTLKIGVLSVADKLGILEKLKSPKSVEDLEIDKRAGEIFLDALTKFGFLKREEKDGKYFYLLSREYDFERLKNFLPFVFSQISAFSELPEIVKEGRKSKMLNIYEGDYLSILKGVNYFLKFATYDLMRKYRFENIRRIMVGSMGVSFASNLVKKFSCNVYFGCYPHLIKHVPELARIYKLPEEKIKSMKEHIGIPEKDVWGDESQKYDLVFLTKKLILKDFDFGDSFLKKSYEVLRDGGYAVVWESIVKDNGVDGPINETILDLFVSESKKRWKETEIINYVLSRGFRKAKVVRCLQGTTTFLVAEK